MQRLATKGLKTIDSLMHLELPAGVDIEVKIKMSLPEAPKPPTIGDRIPVGPPKKKPVDVTPTIIAPGQNPGNVPYRS